MTTFLNAWILGGGITSLIFWVIMRKVERKVRDNGELRASTAPGRAMWKSQEGRASMLLVLFIAWPVFLLWFAWCAVPTFGKKDQ